MSGVITMMIGKMGIIGSLRDETIKKCMERASKSSGCTNNETYGMTSKLKGRYL